MTHSFGATEKVARVWVQDVYRRCLSVVRDASAAEDLTQDAFILAICKIHLYAAGDFPAWVNKIALRLCLNWLKAGRSHRWQGLDGLDSMLSLAPEEFLPPEDDGGSLLY